jgi:hypothetical protein
VTNPWQKQWQYQGRRSTKGWKCTVSLSSVSRSIRWHASLSFFIYVTMWLLYLQAAWWRWLTFPGNAWKLVLIVLGSKLYCAFGQIAHIVLGRGGEGVESENVWIARSVCSYWFRCHDIHDSLWLKHCTQCFDRDIASGVGINTNCSQIVNSQVPIELGI